MLRIDIRQIAKHGGSLRNYSYWVGVTKSFNPITVACDWEEIASGEVLHSRHDGWCELVKKILEIEENQGGEE